MCTAWSGNAEGPIEKGVILRIARVFQPDSERERRAFWRFIQLAQEAVDRNRERSDKESPAVIVIDDDARSFHGSSE
jgi:hypothetical protein